ncbi:MAG: mannose-1-phosphate guanylyltransferase/mannose-6-phosphate isomerase [Nitrosomonadales bacterium]|jgi:mannose-1-phosphate guanylyltransferase/mannose-6-phosphate isomerase|nr:mannose-1-phosphate guanylyltransferase/mannose-6-phosphate isomerase [Nitrosomonadales bacterium]
MNKKSEKIIPVILSGGSGTRLWPLSRQTFPKQFVTLPGEDKSLFQKSIARLDNFKTNEITIENPIIVGNDEHRFIISEQMKNLGLNLYSLILEPSSKNTAPALTLAAFEAIKDGVDPILIVTPSDHIISDINKYTKTIKEAIKIASDGTIITLGIKPTNPSSGFGYIKFNQNETTSGGFNVVEFIEKPSEDLAKKFIMSANYFWNSGIFIMRASTWLSALQSFDSQMHELVANSYNKKSLDNLFIRPEKSSFDKIIPNSIDYSVMEKCPGTNFSIEVLLLEVGWDDLGSWDAFWKVNNKDNKQNVTFGDVFADNTKNSIIYASNRFVCTSDIEDLIVVETADTVLISKRDKSQNIKNIVNQLKLENRYELESSTKVYRPWGSFNTLEAGKNYKVKRISVNPQSKLSLQKHSRRAEHWVVIKGTAEIICGDVKSVLKENQSTYIPMNTFHRLSNTTDNILEIIEVQSGDYLGEDDIVRVSDDYGRD